MLPGGLSSGSANRLVDGMPGDTNQHDHASRNYQVVSQPEQIFTNEPRHDTHSALQSLGSSVHDPSLIQSPKTRNPTNNHVDTPLEQFSSEHNPQDVNKVEAPKEEGATTLTGNEYSSQHTSTQSTEDPPNKACSPGRKDFDKLLDIPEFRQWLNNYIDVSRM